MGVILRPQAPEKSRSRRARAAARGPPGLTQGPKEPLSPVSTCVGCPPRGSIVSGQCEGAAAMIAHNRPLFVGRQAFLEFRGNVRLHRGAHSLCDKTQLANVYI